MGYDHGDRFPFDIEPNGIPFRSKSKVKLSPRSYRIQCERKWKYSFFSVAKHTPRRKGFPRKTFCCIFSRDARPTITISFALLVRGCGYAVEKMSNPARMNYLHNDQTYRLVTLGIMGPISLRPRSWNHWNPSSEWHREVWVVALIGLQLCWGTLSWWTVDLVFFPAKEANATLPSGRTFLCSWLPTRRKEPLPENITLKLAIATLVNWVFWQGYLVYKFFFNSIALS